MKSLRPGAKIVLAFIISFLLSNLLINFIVSKIKQREGFAHREAAKILQQEISERFNLKLDVTLVMGQMASVYFLDFDKIDKNYEELLNKLLIEKKYILGLNQLNPNGKIVTIYPKEPNQKAMGKTSQNYDEVIKSFQRGERYWFSPPFKLFQAGYGFVFYIPIVVNETLRGWIASVISSQLFFEHFSNLDFFNRYELLIKDELTGEVYFETALAPKSGNIEESKSKMWGRSIIFQSWPKASNPEFNLAFSWRLLICLIVGLFGGRVMKTNLQKKKAYSRLKNISDLLKLTSNEALSKLMDIQTEYLSMGSTGFLSSSIVEKDIQSVTNLIEQIELLQNIASSEQLPEENFEILPVLKAQIEEIEDVIRKKNLNVKLNADNFEEAKILGNKWLVSNTVFKNALSYCALIACPAGRIEISHSKTASECSTIFHINKVYDQKVYEPFKVERRLMVARRVMDLLNGQIKIQDDGQGGKFLELIIRST